MQMPPPRSHITGFSRRRVGLLVVCGLGLFWYLGLHSSQGAALLSTLRAKTPLAKVNQQPVTPIISKLIIPKPIKSTTPAAKFRDNLADDHRYIYANHAFGLSNQFIALCKVVTMGHHMGRTPIFDNLHPEHGEGSSPRVSELFDFIPAVNRLGMSLVEFADLKTTDPAVAEDEELSGWEAFGPYQIPPGLLSYKIKTNFWSMPPVMAYYPTMATIELLGNRPPWDWIEANRERMWSKRRQPVPPPPDEVVLSLDQTFWVREARFVNGKVAFDESLEHVDPASFTWQGVGQHVRFQPWVDQLATDFLAALFARHDPDGARPTPAPPTGGFIGVHLRQGDFGDRAVGAGLPVPFHAAVADVAAELRQKFGRAVAGSLPVLFATDSDDPLWIRSVEEAYGWVYLDHSVWDREREGEHAGWVPSLLDCVVLGRGLGMVGTHMSTFSSLAARRVESWQGGVTRKVKPQSENPQPVAVAEVEARGWVDEEPLE